MSSIDSKKTLNRRTALKLVGAAAGATVFSRIRSASADRRPTRLRTRLSEEFGLRVPLASAGMAFVSLSDLPVAVTRAGAIGVYGVGAEPPNVVEQRIEIIQRRTSGVYGVDFIVDTGAQGPFTTDAHIEVAREQRVPIVVFHFNLPRPEWVSRLQEVGSTVWVQTGDVNVALQAVALGVEGIVAQGRSAGGHNKNATIATFRLVERMRRALPPEIFILAAGGVSDGHSLVRAIRAGADGGWAGTVFVAASESYAHPGYKSRLIDAHGSNATQLTTVFGPEWPGQPQRVLRNRATDNPTSTQPPTIGTTKLFPRERPEDVGIVPVAYTMPKHSAVVPTRDTSGNLDEMDMPAGSESIRSIRKVRSAAEIVDDFIDGANEACERDDHESLDDD
jgi:NAD(P)H-dependent flavin oxidoreductase YrpB (nitropropane dioxygenase family)